MPDRLTNSEFDALMAQLDAALASADWQRITAAGFVTMRQVLVGSGEIEERQHALKRRHDKFVELARTASLDA